MGIEFDKYWAGTEESLAQYAMNLALQLKHGYQSSSDDDDDEEDKRPRLLNIQGSVAVISIRGALTNRDHGYGSYETTYPEIRQALIAAAVDPQVKSIVLDINSPGGMASGINELGDLIYAGRKDKPIVLKQEDMSVSGRLMRTTLYPKYADVGGGKLFPSQMLMVDNVNVGEKSQITMTELSTANLPDKVFSKAFLETVN